MSRLTEVLENRLKDLRYRIVETRGLIAGLMEDHQAQALQLNELRTQISRTNQAVKEERNRLLDMLSDEVELADHIERLGPLGCLPPSKSRRNAAAEVDAIFRKHAGDKAAMCQALVDWFIGGDSAD